MQLRKATRLTGSNKRPCTVIGKKLQQAGIGRTSIQYHDSPNTAGDSVQSRLCLGDHTTGNRAVFRHFSDLIGG